MNDGVSSLRSLLLAGLAVAGTCALLACSSAGIEGGSSSGGSSGNGGGDPCEAEPVRSCTRVRRSGDKPLCVDIFGSDLQANNIMQAYCAYEPESEIADGPCPKTEVVGGCEYKTSLSCHRVWYYPSAKLTSVEEACAEGNGTYVPPPR